MKFDVKSVFIAGGTGFLGYHSALEFLRRDVKVSTIALPNEINLDGWFPKEINKEFGNLFEMSEDDIFAMLDGKGYDTFVYGLGPDERVIPKAPSYDFFHEKLVVQAAKIVRAAKRAGIRRCVVMNSYFAWFDIQPRYNGELSKYHPYIKARVEQADELIKLGESGKFDVMIMQLSYIFGSMPERMPLWKDAFIGRFDKMPMIFFPNGGTTAIHVTGIAEAIVAASYNGENGQRYPIGNVNIRYKDMINYMMLSKGSKKRFVPVPASMCAIAGKMMDNKEKKEGKQSGMSYEKLMTQIQSKNLFINSEKVKKALGYEELGFNGGECIWKGIQQTIKKCYPDTYKEVPFPTGKEIKCEE